MSNPDTRAAFEAYFLASRKSKGVAKRPTFERRTDDTYNDDHTQRHWWTWQQAVAATKADTTGARAGDGKSAAPVVASSVSDRDEAIRVWHQHCDPFKSWMGTTPPSPIIDAMLAFAAAPAVSAPAWQPIETAPMDGTPFWGWRPRGMTQQGVAYRVPRDDCEMWYFAGSSAAVDIVPELKPTHWMPLPAAPGA